MPLLLRDTTADCRPPAQPDYRFDPSSIVSIAVNKLSSKRAAETCQDEEEQNRNANERQDWYIQGEPCVASCSWWLVLSNNNMHCYQPIIVKES